MVSDKKTFKESVFISLALHLLETLLAKEYYLLPNYFSFKKCAFKYEKQGGHVGLY